MSLQGFLELCNFGKNNILYPITEKGFVKRHSKLMNVYSLIRALHYFVEISKNMYCIKMHISKWVNQFQLHSLCHVFKYGGWCHHVELKKLHFFCLFCGFIIQYYESISILSKYTLRIQLECFYGLAVKSIIIHGQSFIFPIFPVFTLGL